MIVDTPSADPAPLESLFRSTGLMVNKANDLFLEIFEAALRPHGLRTREFTVLTAIDSMGPQSQQRLAQTLGIDRTTMVSVVDGLERLGLVERARDRADRRRYAVGLTDRGQKLLRGELTSAMVTSLDAFLAPLTPDERAQIHGFLCRLVSAHVSATGETYHLNGTQPQNSGTPPGDQEARPPADSSSRSRQIPVGYGTGQGSTVPGGAGR